MRLRRSSRRNPWPLATGASKLHAALMELGMPFTADAIENARVTETGGELQITDAARVTRSP